MTIEIVLKAPKNKIKRHLLSLVMTYKINKELQNKVSYLAQIQTLDTHYKLLFLNSNYPNEVYNAVDKLTNRYKEVYKLDSTIH